MLTNASKRLKAAISRFKAYLPTRIPTTVEGMAIWCDEIITLAGFPVNNSFRHSVLTMVMHLGPESDRKAKQFFIKALRKAAANQISYNLIQGIRDEERGQEAAKSVN